MAGDSNGEDGIILRLEPGVTRPNTQTYKLATHGKLVPADHWAEQRNILQWGKTGDFAFIALDAAQAAATLPASDFVFVPNAAIIRSDAPASLGRIDATTFQPASLRTCPALSIPSPRLYKTPSQRLVSSGMMSGSGRSRGSLAGFTVLDNGHGDLAFVSQHCATLGQWQSAEDQLAPAVRSLVEKVREHDNISYPALLNYSNVTLEPQSTWGFRRSDVVEYLGSQGRPQALLLEAILRYGMPAFGFLKATARFQEDGTVAYQTGGGYEAKQRFGFDWSTMTPTISQAGDGKIYLYDYPRELILMLEDGGIDPSKIRNGEGLYGPMTFEAWLHRSAVALQEELLHFLDFALPGAHTGLMLEGPEAQAIPPLIQGDSAAFVKELADRHGVPFDALYTDAVHFATELRADRLFAYLSQGANQSSVRVSDGWLFEHLAKMRDENSWQINSMVMHHLSVFVTLLDDPQPIAQFNRLLPPELWQDISDPRFYRISTP